MVLKRSLSTLTLDTNISLASISGNNSIRDERKREVEEHVEHVNKLLRESGAIEVDSADEQSGSDQEANEGEWAGFPDRPNLDIVDHEEEYIDEDRYTTVTVESVSISRDGLERPEKPQEKAEEDEEQEKENADQDKSKTPARPKRRSKSSVTSRKLRGSLRTGDKGQKAKPRARRAGRNEGFEARI
ncbi:hypothetical protein TrVFT333_011446 [Trichoderma virens FT-333]|nr:hypothetical protein TrVFT333_011446 [Trichoderma virens FT-333]